MNNLDYRDGPLVDVDAWGQPELELPCGEPTAMSDVVSEEVTEKQQEYLDEVNNTKPKDRFKPAPEPSDEAKDYFEKRRDSLCEKFRKSWSKDTRELRWLASRVPGLQAHGDPEGHGSKAHKEKLKKRTREMLRALKELGPSSHEDMSAAGFDVGHGASGNGAVRLGLIERVGTTKARGKWRAVYKITSEGLKELEKCK